MGFFDGSLLGESSQIDDLIAAKDAIYEKGVGKRNPRLSCYYVTTGNYEKPVRIENLRKGFTNKVLEMNIFDSGTMRVEMVGAKQLQQWYRTATSAVEAEIEFPRNVVMPSNQHVEEAYIGYLDATNLLKLFTMQDEYGSKPTINRSVFFDNIRDYDSKSKINLSIKESVKADGGNEFVFRNNGITVISKNIDRTGDRFRLEDFQIVNGCQTSNIIYDLVYGENHVESGDQALARSIQVPLRLISAKDDDFVSSIIIGTNRQNAIRDDQFWALRPFMKSLEEYCKNLGPEEIIYFERRDNQYRNQEVELTRVMQPSVLMKAVAACLLFQPQRAARDYRGILSEYREIVFLDDHDVPIYHAVAYLYYRLEFLWRNQRLDNKFKTFRYYLLAGVGLHATKSRDVFAMKSPHRKRAAEDLIMLCKDEDKLKSLSTGIVSAVEQQLEQLGIDTQERIRDAIRSDTFSNSFRTKMANK